MAINTREELEEERRLFYVVITRAKERLWISYANTRYRFGNLIQNEPSRFLDELPEKYIDRSFAGGGARNQGNNRSAYDRMNGGGWGSQSADQAEKRYGPTPSKKPSTTSTTPSYISPKPPAKAVEHVPSADFVASDISNLQVGQRVEHQKFGFGEVVKMEGSAHNPIATVKFELNGEKKIMLIMPGCGSSANRQLTISKGNWQYAIALCHFAPLTCRQAAYAQGIQPV
jgi:DNA helicase-2/ATP-dependent DNA helicase PcrA